MSSERALWDGGAVEGGRRILFVTGTRADFGKLKPLMRVVNEHPDCELHIFVTGMHTLRRYGYTVHEIEKTKLPNLHVFMNQHVGEPMEMVLANTVQGLSRYIHEERPDLVVVHGDRVEALAGAIAGALTNTRVAHIEGGEVSGTIDELIRHSTTKMAHLHLVANDEAYQRLVQMGEREEAIFTIGSPDIDVMMSDELPALDAVKRYYEIDFDEYGILLFHPVTTALASLGAASDAVVEAVLASGRNFVVIHPNNDEGTRVIMDRYRRFFDQPQIRMFPSVAFESFLVLLRHAKLILGNSSAGIREAPVYGTWAINVGNRQQGRQASRGVVHVPAEKGAIADAITRAWEDSRPEPSFRYGRGDSATRFKACIDDGAFWSISPQKAFVDLPDPSAS